MKEIILRGRGGQGVAFAAELLVHAFMAQGKCASGIPQFGFERRGAPVAAFLKVDDAPVREKTLVYEADCVVIMDPGLKRSIDIYKGLKPGSLVVLNQAKTPKTLELPATVSRVGVVDATGIALVLLNLPIPNSPMLGAFVRTTGWLTWEALRQGFLGAFPPSLVEVNIKAAQEAYELTQVKELAVP